MVSLFLYNTYMYKKEEEHANALVNRRTSSLWSELFSISLPLFVPKKRYESSSCNRRIFLARPTLSKLTLSFKRHRAIGGAKRKKTSGGLAKHRLRSVARELQVARRRLSRLPRTFSTSSPRAFRLFPVLLLRLFSFFSPFSLSLSLSLFLSYSRSIFYLSRIRSRTSTPLPIFMALVPSVCSHFFFERSSRHQDTTCASVTSEVRASLTTIMTHTQPWTMMASLENKVDEQVSKVPQQNGGNCRNEELQLEDFRDNNNESIEVEMVVPPDGGWGWMIVAASFMCNLFVDGIIFSFGVFLNDISEAFAVSKARVALVGSLQSGFYLMAGPFVSALANRYGFRLVAILGSVISCSAFVLSYFSTSIEFLYISYGVLGGIGAGLIYVPAVITTGFYFERWRALATGIAVCGSGIGAFMLAPISDILVKQFGWRGALLFQAGMLLNCATFGAMFRPLKSTRIKVKSSPENAGLEVKSSLMAKGVSTASLHCMQPGRSGFFGTNNNTDYPTAAELLGSNPNIVNASKSLHSLHKIHAELRTLEKKLSSSEKRLSVPIYPELDVNMDEKMVEEENNLLGGDVERLNGKVPTIRRHTISGRRLRADSDCSQKSLKMGNRRNPFSKDPQRPFYRDDIFYGGSLNRLPHYKSQQSSVGYHMSVTRLPTATDVAEEESGSCYICPESVRRILTTMLDLSLLKSPSFLILAISGGLTMMGFYTPFMYVPDRAQLAGIEASTAMFLVSVIGIGNTIGRVVCGLASSLPGVNALVVNNIFISAAGLFTIFSGLSLSKGYQFFYAAGFGISISVFASLRSILVVDLLGLEKLTNAFGLLLLFQGVAAAVGAPLAGIFMDATGSYDASFYLSGSLIFLSAVICYPLKRINVWETKKNGDKCSDDPS